MFNNEPIIIHILFLPQYKTKQKSQIKNYKLLINLVSAVECRKKEKVE